MRETTVVPLEGLLERVDVTVRSTRRIQLPAHQHFVLPSGETSLVYVADGELLGDPAVSCAVATHSAADVKVISAGDRSEVLARAALVSFGGQTLNFRARTDSTLLVITFQLLESAEWLHRTVPDPLTVTDFAALDPATAGLAAHMGVGPDGGAGAATRAGDSVICRLMGRTVLLAIIRAWATAGCAPADWLARAADPHLERVLTEIHREPGRDWSVEALAAVGNMSRSAFSRRFREFLGASPAQYLASVRMEDAKRKLASGVPVSQASRELGYASDEGFSRAFRRHTGMAPSRWRNGADADAVFPPAA